jgi:hypothetical protein
MASYFARYLSGQSYPFSNGGARSGRRKRKTRLDLRAELEPLEIRTLLSVSLLSSYTGMNQLAAAGPNPKPGLVTIYSPPDTTGAAGPTSYLETANQGISIYTPKATGTTVVTDSMHDFLFTQGGLAQVPPFSASTDNFSDVTSIWDELAQRFIVGVQDVSGSTSNFDIAVSKSASPATLTTADWYFYQVNTGEANRSADYPGNLGYNNDAFVFTLNENSTASGTSSVVQVTSLKISDLIAGNPITPYQSDFNGFSLRPTVMHDSKAGDPMWLLESTAGNGNTINVIKETNELSNSPTFTTTTLNVNAYLGAVQPLQPDGTGLAPASGNGALWTHILKAAEYNNTIVASDQVSVSSTEDDARWYSVDVSSGTPTLKDQGNVSAGNNTYVVFPSIDINSQGDIGMEYSQSGTGTGQFMSMYVTGRNPGDAAGTMQTPVLVKAGVVNNTDGREGDLSGISVDSTPLAATAPTNQSAVEGASQTLNLGSFTDSEGNFWGANEWAATGGSWGTEIGQFSLGGKGPWSVDVNWGDGTSNTTFTTANVGTLGTKDHTFGEEGTYTVTVKVTDTVDNSSDSKTYTVNVSDPAVVATGVAINPAEGTDSGTVAVATFTDPGGAEPNPSDPTGTHYTATIDWGDGTAPTTGAISGPDGSGTFTVSGNHTYGEEGTYTVTTSITHEALPDVIASSSATVSDPAVLPTGGFTFNAAEGTTSAVQTVATFTDPGGAEPNASDPAGTIDSHYSALIDWGDGTTSAGTLSFAGGTYTVQGSHKYATGLGKPDDFGNTLCDANAPSYHKPITVTLSHESAPTATAVSDAVITLPPDSAHIAGDGSLIVVGTTGNDFILINPVGNTGKVSVKVNSGNLGSFALGANGRIIVAAMAGNDDIQVAGGVLLPTVLYGGPGNDRIKGGGGPNIEVGCEGNDQLIGGGKRGDLLIGGAGSDRIVGGPGNDIIIAGVVVNPVTLVEDDKFSDLIAILNGGLVTAVDDGSQDVLTGGAGIDTVYYHFQGGGVLDIVTDKPEVSINI